MRRNKQRSLEVSLCDRHDMRKETSREDMTHALPSRTKQVMYDNVFIISADTASRS
jgi:hypothetical protein